MDEHEKKHRCHQWGKITEQRNRVTEGKPDRTYLKKQKRKRNCYGDINKKEETSRPGKEKRGPKTGRPKSRVEIFEREAQRGGP